MTSKYLFSLLCVFCSYCNCKNSVDTSTSFNTIIPTWSQNTDTRYKNVNQLSTFLNTTILHDEKSILAQSISAEDSGSELLPLSLNTPETVWKEKPTVLHDEKNTSSHSASTENVSSEFSTHSTVAPINEMILQRSDAQKSLSTKKITPSKQNLNSHKKETSSQLISAKDLSALFSMLSELLSIYKSTSQSSDTTSAPSEEQTTNLHKAKTTPFQPISTKNLRTTEFMHSTVSSLDKTSILSSDASKTLSAKKTTLLYSEESTPSQSTPWEREIINPSMENSTPPELTFSDSLRSEFKTESTMSSINTKTLLNSDNPEKFPKEKTTTVYDKESAALTSFEDLSTKFSMHSTVSYLNKTTSIRSDTTQKFLKEKTTSLNEKETPSQRISDKDLSTLFSLLSKVLSIYKSTLQSSDTTKTPSEGKTTNSHEAKTTQIQPISTENLGTEFKIQSSVPPLDKTSLLSANPPKTLSTKETTPLNNEKSTPSSSTFWEKETVNPSMENSTTPELTFSESLRSEFKTESTEPSINATSLNSDNAEKFAKEKTTVYDKESTALTFTENLSTKFNTHSTDKTTRSDTRQTFSEEKTTNLNEKETPSSLISGKYLDRLLSMLSAVLSIYKSTSQSSDPTETPSEEKTTYSQDEESIPSESTFSNDLSTEFNTYYTVPSIDKSSSPRSDTTDTLSEEKTRNLDHEKSTTSQSTFTEDLRTKFNTHSTVSSIDTSTSISSYTTAMSSEEKTSDLNDEETTSSKSTSTEDLSTEFSTHSTKPSVDKSTLQSSNTTETASEEKTKNLDNKETTVSKLNSTEDLSTEFSNHATVPSIDKSTSLTISSDTSQMSWEEQTTTLGDEKSTSESTASTEDWYSEFSTHSALPLTDETTSISSDASETLVEEPTINLAGKKSTPSQSDSTEDWYSEFSTHSALPLIDETTSISSDDLETLVEEATINLAKKGTPSQSDSSEDWYSEFSTYSAMPLVDETSGSSEITETLPEEKTSSGPEETIAEEETVDSSEEKSGQLESTSTEDWYSEYSTYSAMPLLDETTLVTSRTPKTLPEKEATKLSSQSSRKKRQVPMAEFIYSQMKVHKNKTKI